MYGALYTTPLCYDIRWHHNLSYRPLISRLDYSPSVSIQLCDWLLSFYIIKQVQSEIWRLSNTT